METRGYKNNNPLNIRYSAMNNWQGEMREHKKDNAFCEFLSLSYGYRAVFILLSTYQEKYDCNTIEDFIKRWAPSTENDTEDYICFVVNDMKNIGLNVTKTSKIDLEDKRYVPKLLAMVRAMSKYESGFYEWFAMFEGLVMALGDLCLGEHKTD